MQEKEIHLQKFCSGLRRADLAPAWTLVGGWGDSWIECSLGYWHSKRPHSFCCGVSKKKGQALLIAVSGVWEAAEAVCDRGRRSHVWEDGGPAEAAGGDDGRCRRSKEWSRR